ncbi:MAG TPA: SurA N-terminal domain-containing protein [Candidatus Brocadiia bacterium]|nr:SurA N-terminal domain-containing protein [Candidatus Brocadiia bacterium]
MAMRWFRQHQRHILPALVILLMATWGIGGSLSIILREKSPVIGTIYGREVKGEELSRFHNGINMLYRMELMLAGQYGQFLLQRKPTLTTEDAWNSMLRVSAAERWGLSVGATELATYQKEIADRFKAASGKPLSQILNEQGISPGLFDEACRNILLQQKLNMAIANSVTITQAEVWDTYAQENEKARLRFVAFAPEKLEPLVKVTDEDVKAFYEQHKDQLADRAAGKYGYRWPRRVRIQVAEANFEELAKDIQVTEDRIKARYEENKDFRYKKEEPVKKEEPAAKEGETPTTAPTAPETPAPPAEPEKNDKPADKDEGDGDGEEAPAGAPATAPAPAAATPAGDKAAETPKPEDAKPVEPPKVEYKPLEEVREDIIMELKEEQSQGKAQAMRDQFIMDLLNQSAESSKTFTELATESGFKTYVPKSPETGSELLTPEEIEKTLDIDGDDAEKIGAAALQVPLQAVGRRGVIVCTVLEEKASEPALFDEVKVKARAECVREKAFQMALSWAEKCAGKVRESSFQSAVEEIRKEVAAEFARAAETSLEKKEIAAPELADMETDLFRRPSMLMGGGFGDSYIQAMGGFRPEVVREAFRMQLQDARAVVDGKPDAKCYVIQLIEKKAPDAQEFEKSRSEFMQRCLRAKQNEVVAAWAERLSKSGELNKAYRQRDKEEDAGE